MPLVLIYLHMHGVHTCKGKTVFLYTGLFAIDYTMFCKYCLKVGYGERAIY